MSLSSTVLQPSQQTIPITFTEELITPDIAKNYLLNFNTGNRTIRRRHVEALARTLANAGWQLNSETIKFSASGRLIDGQHRLEAVIVSGVPLLTNVARNVPEEAYGTLDQGSKRKASDDIAALGIANSHKVAAAAKIIITWKDNLPARSTVVTKDEIAHFALDNPALADLVSVINSQHKPPIPISAVAAVGWMATRDPNYVPLWNSFAEKLASGVGLADTSPILALRNLALKLRRGTSIAGDIWFAVVATAWNEFCRSTGRRSFRLAANSVWPNEVLGYSVKRDPKGAKSPFTFTGPTRKTEDSIIS